MKFQIVSANAQLRCAHGGTVQVTPSMNTLFKGIVPLCTEDIMGASIVGCTVPQSNSSKPYQKVVSLTQENQASSYGAESGQLFSEIMDVNEPPPANVNEFTRLLEQYYELIECNQGESEAVLKLRLRLNELSGDAPDLITTDMEIERRRVLYGTQKI